MLLLPTSGGDATFQTAQPLGPTGSKLRISLTLRPLAGTGTATFPILAVCPAYPPCPSITTSKPLAIAAVATTNTASAASVAGIRGIGGIATVPQAATGRRIRLGFLIASEGVLVPRATLVGLIMIVLI